MVRADWPDGVDRIIVAEVDSTSREIARRSPARPTWLLAHMQTAGKGRRGRGWTMAEGNFAASLAWRPGGTPARMALRSFTASLSLRDALASFGVAGLSLKWPNDVLLNEGKLAGILLEVPSPDLLILGVGVNLRAAPPPAEVESTAVVPVSLLAETGLTVEPTSLLDALARTFADREEQFASRGFASIRTDWMRHAARVGETITVRLPGETLCGIFEDIDDDGHLILGTDAGARRISAGDVHFGRTMPEVARCS